jgi:hypothetical protein
LEKRWRRSRRGSGAGMVWERKGEEVSIYRCAGWPAGAARSTVAPAIQDAKGQGDGGVV